MRRKTTSQRINDLLPNPTFLVEKGVFENRPPFDTSKSHPLGDAGRYPGFPHRCAASKNLHHKGDLPVKKGCIPEREGINLSGL